VVLTALSFILTPNKSNMKHSSPRIDFRNKFLYLTLLTALFFAGCSKIKEPPPPVLKITTLASGLASPVGLTTDKKGLVWVAEGGTGKHDGKVSAITPDGKKYDVIVNMASEPFEGDISGPTHLLFADGILYILGAVDRLYKADVSAYKPGDAPIDASKLASEDIAAFVMAYPWKRNAHDSHPYNLTLGPNGNIYITDAGANAILRRDRTGVLSVVAEIPPVANPTPVGPPEIDPVPTGIIYDGQNFLVSTLTGFPFPPKLSTVYKVSPSGNVSPYQTGFTMGVDIAQGGFLGRLVVELGQFGPTGFVPKTGRLVWANGGGTVTPLAEGLNMPAGITQASEHEWYVTSLADGTVLKVNY
jgi:hypothetical protein